MGMTIVLSSVLANAGIERFLHKDFGNYRLATVVKRDKETPNEKHSDHSDEAVANNKSSALLQRLQASSFLALARNNQNPRVDPEMTRQEKPSDTETRDRNNEANRKPKEQRLVKAHSFNGDLRDLPYRKPVKRERPEREGPEPNPGFYPGTSGARITEGSITTSVPAINAPAPAPSASFDGLDFATWGAGHPPDTNGDVGPTYYIQTVNTSIGIYRKSDAVRVAAFGFNTFMSMGNFGNLCDTNNFGDPVVLYDSFEDRWIITDFAFTFDGSGNISNPPGSFQCIAASKTGDPVSGGWNFYSINTTGGLGDYPKFGIWPDGLYMSTNMFDYAAAGSYQNVRAYAFNKAQMYAGAPTVQSVSFDLPASYFSLLPSNARLQAGTPPPGSPNYFISTEDFVNALTVFKFHVDWDRISLSTFTGPDIAQAATSWPNTSVANAPSLGGNLLDVLEIRPMMQNQYSKIGGTESLWTTHTVRRQDVNGFAAPRWYQVDVTGGTVAANLPQAATWDPDGANVIYRFMPSLALDRMGNMALGYSTSNSTTKPAIKYAGRLATDPLNTLGQTEQVLIQGTGTQTGNCGGGPCARWGDYSAMSLDPNGCTFWYTNEYYAVDGQNDLTRIGSFAFPQCVPLGAGGTVSGTVTDSVTTNPINGAKVVLGSRTTNTNVSGIYTFTNLPAGIYPGITASFAGYNSSTATNIVVTDGATTTQNFSLTTAPLSACFVETSQADFQTGVLANVDLTTSPGNVVLDSPASVDQQNLTVTTSGFGFTSTSWAGQTFTPAVTGSLSRVDLDLFCSNCTDTTPNLTVSIRATTGNVPTGADLAVATIPGFNSGSGGYFSANFSAPATLIAGTKYAVIIRAVADPTAGSYAYTCSCSPNSNPYSAGQRVTSANSGSTWATDNTSGGRDLGFIAYMKTGFSLTGNLVSGARDANPPSGLVPHWTTLSWNGITPAGTAIKLQGAASNSLDGPFNFVGPDGTAATFFTTSGASLAQFNGFRYLKYKALLSTTDSAVTPTLNDVTTCFSDGTPVITAAAPLVRQRGANTNGQIATVSDPSQPANTLNVSATPLTGTGVTVTSISVDAAGTVTANVAASCVATTSTFTLTVTNNSAATATDTLTVSVTATATPTITPGGPTTFCTGGSVTLSSSSASNNQWFLNGNPIGGATNQQYTATTSGNYTVAVTELGCATTSAPTAVTVNPVPATPTITPGSATTFCDGGTVSLTSSSASGNQWYRNGSLIAGATNQQYVATISGNYTTIVTTGGCSSTPSVATTVTVNPTPPKPTITPNGPTTFFEGGSVTLTSSSATGNQWYQNGNPISGATNQQYIANASGNYTVTATASGCTSTPSAATTVTVNPVPVSPAITKAFNPTNIPLNSSSTLSFTINNPNTTSGLSGVGFVDNLPAGLVVAATPNVTGSCGAGTITATASSSSISLSGGTLTASPAAGSSCTFTVAVKGTTAGTKLNTTNAITSTEAGTGVTSNTAALTVVAPPVITKSFGPTTMAPGGVTTLTFNISNPGSNTVQLSGVAFTDNFPVNLVVANPNGLTNTCGGTATSTPGSGTLLLTGGTIPVNSSCTLSVMVTTSVGGNYINNTNAVSSTNGGNGNSAAASLTVIAPPTINKIFQPNTVVQNGTTLLSFTISNPNTNTSLTGISFADNLPGGLVLASPNDLTNGCGGTVTAIAGSSSISLVGGMLGPGSNPLLATCAISVKVKAPNTLGTLNNTTGSISANETVGGATSNTASLTVIAPPVAPTIAKSFGAASIPLNGTTSLTFTLANPNSTVTLMNVSASDTLPAGLVVATPNHLISNCTGTITANAGNNGIGITALNLAASNSCSFSVDVTGTSIGAKNNISGNVSATYIAGSGNPVPITGGTATATINVLKGNQTINFAALPDKAFGDVDFIVSASASSGLTATLTATGNCTVTSPSPGTVHITGAGSCTITASQGGDGNYNSAANVPQSFDISKAATTTDVLASINPSDIGQNVVFTATVTPSPNTNSPTGTVQFKDGVNNLGAAINCLAAMGNTCTAQFSSTTLTTGTHAISAVYSGDTNFSSGTGLLTGGQVVTDKPTLILILDELGPNPNQAAALDSLLFLRDPFPIDRLATWYNFGPDLNTRVMLFVANLQLNQGESSSAVVVNLIDSNNQSYDVPAEDVRPERVTGFAQVTFRLPDTLFFGDCTVQVKAHGQVSNSGIIRIGP